MVYCNFLFLLILIILAFYNNLDVHSSNHKTFYHWMMMQIWRQDMFSYGTCSMWFNAFSVSGGRSDSQLNFPPCNMCPAVQCVPHAESDDFIWSNESHQESNVEEKTQRGKTSMKSRILTSDFALILFVNLFIIFSLTSFDRCSSTTAQSPAPSQSTLTHVK